MRRWAALALVLLTACQELSQTLVPARSEGLAVLAAVNTPRWLKERALATLEALPSTTKMGDKRIEEAMGYIAESLNRPNWMDDSHIDGKKAEQIFALERKAVRKLMEIKAPGSPIGAAIDQAIQDLVAAERLLAAIAIGEISDPDKPQKLAKAAEELAKGDREAAKGHPDVAVEQYQKAWKEAQKAMVPVAERLNSLIASLFSGKTKGAVQQAFDQLKRAVAENNPAQIEAGIVAFVASLLAGRSELPRDDATLMALCELINGAAELGGLPSPLPSCAALADDGALGVVGPTGGTVVTMTGIAGIAIPPGAIGSPIVVTAIPLPRPTEPRQGPLPTDFAQYPHFYEFETWPRVSEFAWEVIVGLCVFAIGDPLGPPTQAAYDRLQVAHPDPADPETIELLRRVNAAFLTCGAASSGGIGGATRKLSPFAVVDPEVPIEPSYGRLAVGNFHACGIRSNGQTWCWGTRASGALGDGSAAFFSVPVAVSGNPQFLEINTRGAHTCGRRADGTHLCWGRNTFGAVGSEDLLAHLTPTLVTGGAWLQIAPGRLHSCGLAPDHQAWCWGSNQEGEKGNPAFPLLVESATHVPVVTDVRFGDLSAGWLHTCGVEYNAGFPGAVWCWGSGFSLGNGGFLNYPTPAPTPGGLTFTRVFAGGRATCALTAALEAYCWGFNSGTLGDGTLADRVIPTRVGPRLTFVMLSVGTAPHQVSADLTVAGHTCGITTTGRAYCWGRNNFGQLGTGDLADRLVPVPVQTDERFVAIGAGDAHTCAMRIDGAVFCWGRNSSGELGGGFAGDPETLPRRVPPPF